jgi:hypothetical protein
VCTGRHTEAQQSMMVVGAAAALALAERALV